MLMGTGPLLMPRPVRPLMGTGPPLMPWLMLPPLVPLVPVLPVLPLVANPRITDRGDCTRSGCCAPHIALRSAGTRAISAADSREYSAVILWPSGLYQGFPRECCTRLMYPWTLIPTLLL